MPQRKKWSGLSTPTWKNKMSIEISCMLCNKDLGVIRDGRLRRGINHVCAECTGTIECLRAATSENMKPGRDKYDPLSSIFDGIFGSKRKW